MYWRRFEISKIPLHDSIAFEKWLRNRWIEKDKLIELYLRTGRFPADRGVDKDVNGKTRRGIGYVEAEIKTFHWYEFLQVFAPIGVLAMVLFMFYGSLPTQLFKAVDRQALIENLKAFAQGNKLTGLEKKALPAPETINRKQVTGGPNTPALTTNKHVPNSSHPRKLENSKTGTRAKDIGTSGLLPSTVQKANSTTPQKLKARSQKAVPNKSVPKVIPNKNLVSTAPKLNVKPSKNAANGQAVGRSAIAQRPRKLSP